MCRTLIYIHHQELPTVLLYYHIGRFVLGSLCVGDLVLLGLSSIRVAGLSLYPQKILLVLISVRG